MCGHVLLGIDALSIICASIESIVVLIGYSITRFASNGNVSFSFKIIKK